MFKKQIYFLLWKNLILRKRHGLRTFVEVVWPLFLFAILVSIRQYETLESQSECHYPARALPSAGVYPWLKGFLCNVQNPCFNEVVPSEIPGQVNPKLNQSDDTSKIITAFNNIVSLLTMDTYNFTNITKVLNGGRELQDVLQNGNSLQDLESKTSSLGNQFNGYRKEIDSIREPLQSVVQSLSFLQDFSNQASWVSLLLGVNVSSPTALDVSSEVIIKGRFSNLPMKFCDHPLPSNNQSINESSSQTTFLSGALKQLVAGLDPRSSDFCPMVFQRLEYTSRRKIHVLWMLIKPFILGKIPYFPKTNVTKLIIKNANFTYQTLGSIHEFGVEWQSSIGPKLYDMLEKGNQANDLRRLLGFATEYPIIAEQFGPRVSVDQLKMLQSFLLNDNKPHDDITTWKDVYHQVDDTIAWVTKILECVELDRFVGFDSEEELVQYSMERIENKTLWGGIVFESPSNSDSSLPRVVKYKIRQDAGSVTKTSYIQRFIWKPGAESNASAAQSSISQAHPVTYYISGFVHIQDMIENGIILTASGKSVNDPDYNMPLGGYLQEMPYPCYTRDKFLEFLPGLFSLIMTLAWVYSVCIIIKNIVYEKEKRLKEVMKMMGLSNGVHWVAWFINAFLMMFCSILLLILFLRFGNILPFSNLFIVLMWLTSFAIATIAQCFLVSCFFTRANLAAACGGIIFFVLYIPYNVVYIFDKEMSYSNKLTACLLSSVSFGYGASYISQYEMSGHGIQFSNWAKNYNPAEEMNFLTSLIMMLVDAAIYLILTWYVENVYPGTYGVPKRWNFFMSKSYWLGKPRRTISAFSRFNSVDMQEEGVKVESEPEHLPLGVTMQKLKKVFNNGKVAVDGLSLNFYEGQITSFLGHNGAGKTTTMSLLTGLYTPTSGSALIYGNDIQTEMDEIRHQLGFCPQHNVLFGDLTVSEHLRFYSGLKNAVGGKKQTSREIEEMIKDVGLPHKKNEITRHLSGGMKRKLSVAVAFVGGSKCVILDEPTAGVDPYARRGIWDLLLRYRANRTILLSTHHMDEADLLGDRIAIISHGKLKCCGSSLFLKSTFGIGYYLTVVKSNQNTSQSDRAHSNASTVQSDLLRAHSDCAKQSDEGFESSSDSYPLQPSSSALTLKQNTSPSPTRPLTGILETDYFQSNQVMKAVFNAIPSAKIQEENQREITFVLPYSAQTGESYCKLFGELDACGVTYGLTDTSLEEIFLNVAEQNEEEEAEETKNYCFCIPQKRTRRAQLLDSPDRQARRGLRRSATSRSIASNTSDHSLSQLLQRDQDTFLIGETPQVEEEAFEANDGSQGTGSYKVKGNRLVWQQFRALFVKRFHHSRRNWKGLIAQVVLPATFVALGLLCALAAPTLRNLPPLELQPWMYGSTNTFYSHDLPNNSLVDDINKSLLDTPSLGMKCVDEYDLFNYDGNRVTCVKSLNGPWNLDNSTSGRSQDVSSNNTLFCMCTDTSHRVLLAECPFGAGGSATPRALMQSSDWMFNMTGRNVSDWLVKTVNLFRDARYGGLSVGETLHTSINTQALNPVVQLATRLSNFSLDQATGEKENVPEFAQKLARTENAKIWFDNNGYHSMPTWINILNNAVLRSMRQERGNSSQFGIVAINHPLNYTYASLDDAARPSAITGTFISISVIFALSFVPASFVLFLIEEKITKAKHLQFVSGVNPTIYWISTFTWDMINYLLPVAIVILIFFCFQTKAYVSAANFPCLVSLLLLYGFSITPMMYPASFYFEVPSTAYVVLTCVNMFIGINASLITFILQALNVSYLDGINDILRNVFLIFPQYCLGRALIDMAIQQVYADAISSITGEKREVDPFTYDEVGRNLLAMALEGVLWFSFTLLLQYKFFVKCRKAGGRVLNVQNSGPTPEEDVVTEQRRILEDRSDDILKIRSLSKVYRKRGTNSNLVAVDRLCVGVPQGECFGLLGVNGAGKTTTFKMLTGDTSPTTGDAFISGQSILGNLKEVQQNTGYCPQFEALNSLLTGREHLIFYAKLRGVPPEDTGRVADWAINKFGLKIYANKPAGTYSGGNKRKLSAAIAFIGCPPIVFLDEPTAGMDPMSRRFLWSRIAEAVQGGRCIVLTSHSMEECEVLCSRLAIMVNGKLKCIGSPQHLKNKYGEGYTITIKVAGLDPNFEELKSFISSKFPNALLKESHCNMVIYQLPFKDVKLANIFIIMENNKAALKIEDYSVSQTTLDEVFVSFAKNQSDDMDDEYGFQPLNDDTVLDYSQMSDRARELAGSDEILMQSFSNNANTFHSSTEQLLV